MAAHRAPGTPACSEQADCAPPRVIVNNIQSTGTLAAAPFDQCSRWPASIACCSALAPQTAGHELHREDKCPNILGQSGRWSGHRIGPRDDNERPIVEIPDPGTARDAKPDDGPGRVDEECHDGRTPSRLRTMNPADVRMLLEPDDVRTNRERPGLRGTWVAGTRLLCFREGRCGRRCKQRQCNAGEPLSPTHHASFQGPRVEGECDPASNWYDNNGSGRRT